MDPISTLASGWAGAGLLGAVLAWLMFVHLPAKDKMVKELITEYRAEKDKLIKDLVEQFRAELAEARTAAAEVHRQELQRLAVALETAIDRAEKARLAMMEATKKKDKE